MSRPSDWEHVFGFGDPTPGDPWEIRQVARTWARVSSEAGYAEGRLRGLLGDDAVVTWVGQAGEQFRSRSSELPTQLGKVEDSYELASEAMYWWADRLDTHQSKADGALARGREAKADLEAAQVRLDSAEEQVWRASGVPAMSAAATAPTPEQVQRAQDRLHAAQDARTSAQGLVDDAQARLDVARALAEDARESRESDARTTARKVHEAAEAGIEPRSRWEKLKDKAADAWDALVTIAKVVVAVLGVIVLVIGGPLAWVVLAAALILLADALMKYANGEGSLLDVGFALLGCIPGTRGLTTFTKLSAAFRSGGLLGATAHVLAAGKVALVDMARGVRALGSARVWSGEGLSLTGGNLRAVRAFFADAAAAEPGLTNTMRRIVSDLPGAELTGLEYRLKGFDSLARKVATDLEDFGDVGVVLGDTKDAIRYTVQSSMGDFSAHTDAAVAGLRDGGFENVTFKNTFGSDGYQGINTTWRDPSTGQTFEVQFHTPESFDAKMANHELYEERRLPDVSPDRFADLTSQMNLNFDAVPTPPGAGDLTLPGDTVRAAPPPYEVRPVMGEKPFQAGGYAWAGWTVGQE